MKNTESNGGKADGLLKIRALKGVRVPAFTNIPADATPGEQKGIIHQFIQQHPDVRKAAVRSSALKEDSAEASFAGAFDTLLNVPMQAEDISKAVQTVQENGQKKLSEVFNTAAEKSMGVVVQRMIENPDFAGVCLSQGYGADDNAYLLINFRQGLGDDLVSGADNGHELRVLRDGPLSPETVKKYPFLPELVESMKKIEKAYNGKPIDTEFAMKDGKVYMLQARPFITKNPASAAQRQATAAAVQKLSHEIARTPENDLLGDMIDINPRELLGYPVAPVNLAIFRKMFANTVVEQARADIGYAPLHNGLLREINGKPYVSLRSAAYSLRPEGIADTTYDKMVQIYRDDLEASPDKQDSVEFDVFLTSAKHLPGFFSKHGTKFTPGEKAALSDAFTQLDQRLSSEIEKHCREGRTALDLYCQKIQALSAQSTPQETLAVLQEGTAIFTKTARLAFYKKALCNDLYGADKVGTFLVAMDTPSEQMHQDLLGYAKGDVTQQNLSKRYGHIRPGQMDIFSPTYQDNLAKHLDLPRYDALRPADILAAENATAQKKQAVATSLAALPAREKKDIEELRTLLAARERVKHEFMHAYDILAQKIKETAPKPAAKADPVLLPDVLTHRQDLHCIEINTKSGTYFGKETVEALPLVITDNNLHKLTRKDVEGKILIMDHADPGYDFLLLFKPAAVITKVGGPASHIAIRVNEYSIPACIGCGIDLATIDSTKSYILDCAQKQQRVGTQQTANDNNVRKKKNASPAP